MTGAEIVRYNHIQAEMRKLICDMYIPSDLRARAKRIYDIVQSRIDIHDRSFTKDHVQEMQARLAELEKEFNS